MKSVLIVTFNKAKNYGAMLQEYALQKKIEERCNVKILNYKDKEFEKVYDLNKRNGSIIKFIIKKLLFGQKNAKRLKKFSEFEKNYINLTEEYENLDENFKSADILVTGSDQVWNYKITHGLSDVYTLNFGSKNIKRISYAASLGQNKIAKDMEKEYESKLSILNEISVREETGRDILESILKRKIEVVLDPTLLLKSDDWVKNLNLKNDNKKYILSYFVEYDKEQIKMVNYLSKKTGLKIIHFDKINKNKNILKSAYSEGPKEFVELIKNAEYIVCTSFHATVFSVIFKKKFWVVPHKSTGSRVTDFLKKIHLSNQIVYTLEDFKNIDIKQDIDYNKANEILDKEREKSIKWLFDHLS